MREKHGAGPLAREVNGRGIKAPSRNDKGKRPVVHVWPQRTLLEILM